MADIDAPIEFLPADLAPGDGRALELDRRDLVISRIRSGDDPLFAVAYDRLWNEFGGQHEMEPEEIIRQRLGWACAAPLEGYGMRYELILVRRQEEFVAVRDHTAVVSCRGHPPEPCSPARAERRALPSVTRKSKIENRKSVDGDGGPAASARPAEGEYAPNPRSNAGMGAGKSHAVVHLSHVLVDPAWRRTGLAGWLRAWPLQTARAGLAVAGLPTNSPIALVAEMEHLDPQYPNRLIRLKAYEKAGFRKVDPSVVPYVQPDFRPPGDIDASGGPWPLPFSLIVRRVGREPEAEVSGAEIRELVNCLYHMYGTGFREQDMAVAWQSLRAYPDDEAMVPLIAPTQ